VEQVVRFVKHLMSPVAMLASEFLATDVAGADLSGSMDLYDMHLGSDPVLHDLLAYRALILGHRVTLLLLDRDLCLF